MAFDRKAYQRQYMKGYMRKRRAPSKECAGCGLFKEYCPGTQKVKSCPLIPTYDNAVTKEDKRIKKLLLKMDKADMLTDIKPIFISARTYYLLQKELDDTCDSMDAVITKLYYNYSEMESNYNLYHDAFNGLKKENDELRLLLKNSKKPNK